jgi:multicomponent Na+:H+ antiporter subunit D
MFTVISPSYVIETVPVMSMLTWLAAIGILAGSVLAIAQYDIKRMLAYSSVSQIGYIILGVGLANNIAMTGGILHILSHSLMKVGLFMVAGAIIYRTGIKNIYQLKGMGKKMPYTMGAFVVGALSMIGIPPTIGFASKFYLAWGALEAGNWVFVVVILLSSLLTAVYFWRIFENVYFGVHETEEIKKDEAPLSMLLPIIAFAVLILLAGLFASLPIEVIKIWVTGVLP